MPKQPSSMVMNDTPARWEERTAQRVIEISRDQLLERSRNIVGAAYELLDEAGLEGLTIRAVLNKTGLSRRAFYERFEGKDDLVLAVFEQAILMAAQFFREQIAVQKEPLERLRLIVSYVVLGKDVASSATGTPNNRRGAALSREHLRLAESRPQDLQAALSPLIAVIAQQLEDGMVAGVVRKGDPQRLAALVYNLVSTTVHTELLTAKNAQPDQVAQAQLANDVWEFCRRAIAV